MCLCVDDAGFYLDTIVDQLSGNVVAGSDDSGFVLRAPSCFESRSTDGSFFNNEAHAVMVGVFVLPRSGCVKLGFWTLWKVSHLAVVTVDMLAGTACVRACMYVWLCVVVCVCVVVCMCVWLYVCMCVCAYPWLCGLVCQ